MSGRLKMAWIRQINMTVGAGGIGTLISDLNVSFQIERSIELSSNTAQFTIYNAKLETRQKILSTGNNIIFAAGYDDEKNIATIFIGTITKSVSKKQGVDWITEIEAMDISANRSGLIYNTVNLSYIAKTPLFTVVNDVASLLSVPVFGLENLTQTLNNGFVYSGNVNNLIKRLNNILSTYQTKIYFDSSEMVIFKPGIPDSRFGIVKLTSNSGLIGDVADISDENEQDGKKRIGFQCLLNPKIKPNSVIIVVSNSVQGSFIVEKVSFIGDNFGGDFICEVEAVA